MKANLFALSLTLALYAAVPAQAGYLVAQSPPNGNGIDMTFYRAADDFTLSAADTIDNIQFWYYAQEQTDLSQVTWGVYQDLGGAPGTLLDTGTVTAATGFDNTNNAFLGTLTLPDFNLAAGTYWLELHAGSSFTDDNGMLDIDWANADDNATAQLLYNTSGGLPSTQTNLSGDEQLTYEIYGFPTVASSPTPEPAAFWLVSPVLLGFWFRQVRGKQRPAR